MNSLKYKGFIGSVGFSETDGVFFGKIEGIDGLVNYEGESVKELTKAFHEAVDDYLSFCQAEGIQPRKSYSGTLNIRISPATHNSIADYAASEGIAINTFIRRALDNAVRDPASVGQASVVGYSTSGRKPQVLRDSAVAYGGQEVAEFSIPSRDIPFAKALADKMGWVLLSHTPKSGLERALEESRNGDVTEYSSFDEMMKDISGEDGEV